MSYCQCRLRLVFSSIFKEFGWSHVALILDRSDLFSWTVGKNLEYGLRKEGLLKFVRELDGNFEDESYHLYLRDASMYARGKCPKIYFNFVVIDLIIYHFIVNVYNKFYVGCILNCFLFFIDMPFIFLIVLILSVRGTLVRKFMLAAHDLEMTKGDWAFLDVEIFQVKVSLFFLFFFFVSSSI